MLPKAYDPKATEDRIYKMWEESGTFTANRDSGKEPFTVSMPPPNATGNLHLGHAVMLALEDIFIRFARMQGKEALWVPGTDHAAIATENVVIRMLKEQGMKDPRKELGRDGLVSKIAEYVEKSRGTIRAQIRKMGSSCDWSRERYTMDPQLNRCVNEVFKRMYDDGLIYRGHRIVNWDPKLQTTVSDDEVDWKEEVSPFYTFQYGPFQISTARPETKFGDKYVVVHPDDERYKDYAHGQTFDCEWINGPIRATVIKDTAVDLTFGTGCMTITPWHDSADFDIAERHGLEKEPVIGLDGRLLRIAGQDFAGMNAEKARPLIVEKLKSKGLLIKTDENYIHNKAVNQRGGGTIEPQVKQQWFIDVNKPKIPWKVKGSSKKENMSLKQIMHSVVHHGDIQIIPDRFVKTYFHWIDNLRDWCISRQIWWGHRVPVWYSVEKNSLVYVKSFKNLTMWSPLSGNKSLPAEEFSVGDYKFAAGTNMQYLLTEPSAQLNIFEKEIPRGSLRDQIEFVANHPAVKIDFSDEKIKSVVANNYEEACQKLGTDYVIQDSDTLDTWFSSALWTWSTLVDPKVAEDPALTLQQILEKSPDYQRFHPTTVMETGYDILFFWVARMILMTTYATGTIPFKTVYLHGLIRTRDGKKMSKSDPKTMIDPLDMIKKYGADALRLSMIVGQSPGADSKLYEEKIAGYRNFVNKLWNASRFVLMKCEEAKVDPSTITNLPAQAKFSLADRALLHALEVLIGDVTKGFGEYRLSEVGERLYSFVWDYFCDWYLELSKGSANTTVLVHALRTILRLLHPYCPFVTEELWSSVKSKHAGMLIQQEWPVVDMKLKDQQAFMQLQVVIDVITAIRKIRADYSVESGKKIPVIIYTDVHLDLLQSQREHVQRLAGVGDWTLNAVPDKHANAASVVLKDIEIHVPLTGVFDREKEREKLIKERDSLLQIKEMLSSRLADSHFLERAPADIIDGEKERLSVVENRLQKINEILQSL